MEPGQTLSVHDIDDMLKAMWTKHKSTPPTITIYPDGYHELGEPDVDDTPLAVDDIVAWSVLRSSLLRGAALPGERLPYLLGVVQSIEPWDESLAGMVYVRFGNGSGAWKERDQLKKMPDTGEVLLDKPWLRKGFGGE